jgi:hypothetical protein
MDNETISHFDDWKPKNRKKRLNSFGRKIPTEPTEPTDEFKLPIPLSEYWNIEDLEKFNKFNGNNN